MPGPGSPSPQRARLDDTALEPAPIPPAQILAGNPVARSARLTGSPDGAFNACLWTCTPGKFRWRYRSDEVIYVVAGRARVEPEQGGEPLELVAGDVAQFRRETSAVWEVLEEVRKVAVLREDPPDPLARVRSGLQREPF